MSFWKGHPGKFLDFKNSVATHVVTVLKCDWSIRMVDCSIRVSQSETFVPMIS